MENNTACKKTSFTALSLIVVTAVTALSACTPPEAPETANPSEAPSQVTPLDSEGDIVTLYVGPEQVDCVGVASQKCLLVRESTEIDYSYFYSTIEGFDYEPGYNYELLVEKTPIDNPPADSSSIRWTLIEVVEQTPASP